MVFTVVLAVLLSIYFANAAIPNAVLRRRLGVPKIPIPERTVTSPNGTALPPLTTIYYFDQLIDHNDPSLGTFKQRYWMNWEFYEPGGPMILKAPEEFSADDFLGYLTNRTIGGVIAQQQRGATFLIEHRFFGHSNPYDDLSSQSLELLTVQQAIDDLVYFVQNVDLPMHGDDDDGVNRDTIPWVLVGGSYSGALTSWTMVNKPGVFRAGYASSAVVEAITDYYGYFTPIREYMPQNCSSDVQAVIAYLDKIYAENDTAAMQNLKDAFGLGSLSHIEDLASALQYNLIDWQYLDPDVGPGAIFFEFCDALEVKDGVSASATGWGLENAIRSWGSFWNNTYYAHFCGETDPGTCLGTYNTSEALWSNITVDNASRSWFWMICNQLGSFPTGPPPGQPAIASRIVQPAYYERMCVNYFPEKFYSPPSPSVAEVNRLYTGWNVNVNRLFFANGRRDPWREATVSADGLCKASTETQPIYESDGFHTSDMIWENGIVDETVHAVQIAALQYMKTWLA